MKVFGSVEAKCYRQNCIITNAEHNIRQLLYCSTTTTDCDGNKTFLVCIVECARANIISIFTLVDLESEW